MRVCHSVVNIVVLLYKSMEDGKMLWDFVMIVMAFCSLHHWTIVAWTPSEERKSETQTSFVFSVKLKKKTESEKYLYHNICWCDLIFAGQMKHMKVRIFECREPSYQAFKLGLAAAALLALAHAISNLLGGCICIWSKEALGKASPNKQLAVASLVFSWYFFITITTCHWFFLTSD